MNLDVRVKTIRGLIETSGSKICSVTFIKKDGSERVMQVQQAAIYSRIKGDAASESAKKAVATRKANNPNLIAVYDISSKGIRSINAETVTKVVVGGQEVRFV